MSDSIYEEEKKPFDRKEYDKKWRAAHPDYNKNQRANPEYHKLWHQSNKSKVAEYREANKEKLAESYKRYRKSNPALYAEFRRFRNTLKERAIPLWYEEEAVAQLYQKCAELNERLDLEGNDKLCVDHIIPINNKTVCGLHCWANLQLLSRSDNSSKNNKYQQDW